MKAFLVGLIFLFVVVILSALGILLLPLLIVLGWLLQFLFTFILIIFSVWFLGKLIIFVWGLLKE